MFCDIMLMEENNDAKNFARLLGYSKIYFKDDIKRFGMHEAKDYSEARNLIENKRIKILLNPHLFGKKDLYSTDRIGLDHIICEAAKKNEVAVAFSIDKINSNTELNWVMKSIKLCRKYKVKVFFFSFASNKYQMIGRIDFLSLLRVMGLTGKEANTALSLCEFV